MPQTPNAKKFLDADGLTYFASLLNNYPTNNVLQAVIDAIDQVKADKTDIVNSDWNATSGAAEILNKPTIPNVPAWALTSAKPTYTASEVGALPSNTTYVSSINGESGAVTASLPYIVELTQVEDEEEEDNLIYQSTETVAEVKTKIDNGIIVILRYGNELLYSVGYDRGANDLTFLGGMDNQLQATPVSSIGNTWYIRRVDEFVDWDNVINKPTIPNVPAWALESTKPTYTASEVGATTTSDVNGLIASAIGDINSFDVAIVSTLPTTDISTHTIYFMANSASGNNVYDEYMYINGNWELLGSTTIDLSNYLQKTDIADWAKAATKPSYTANEVGAVPINGNGGMVLNAVAGSVQGQGLFLSSGSIAFQKGSDSYTSTGIVSDTSGLRLFSGSSPSNTTNLVRVMNVASPTANADAANKQYVDNAITNFTYTETDPTVPAWAKAASKPTYTAAEVGALPDTTVIPAAQVNADWNATSGVAQILNKPTIPAATTVTQVLTSGTVIATINGTNIYAPSYTDADGVSY